MAASKHFSASDRPSDRRPDRPDGMNPSWVTCLILLIAFLIACWLGPGRY